MQNVSFVRKNPFSAVRGVKPWSKSPGISPQSAVGGVLSRVVELGGLGMFLPT